MQGFNMGRYVPPEHEGVTSGNALHQKTKQAAPPTVRFEMPFAVWCAHCAPDPSSSSLSSPSALIGQGVRFNAEKRRVGYYHSTPVWAFRLRHPPCGGVIEIRTDPQNTAYVVTSGGRKRAGDKDGDDDESLVTLRYGSGSGAGAGGSGSDFAIQTDQERADRRESAFRALEKTIADRARLQQTARRIDELRDLAGRRWEDPYTLNQNLRRAFRRGRHQRERDAAGADDLRDRMSLGIELLPAREEDARRAALVDFRNAGGGGGGGGASSASGGGEDNDRRGELAEKALARPLFPIPVSASAPASEAEGRKKEETRREKDKRKDDGREREQIKSGTKPTKKSHAEHKSRRRKEEAAAARIRESLVAEIVGNTRAAMDPFLDFRSREPSTSRGPVLLPGIKRKRAPDEAPDEAPDPDPDHGPGPGSDSGPPPEEEERPTKVATKPGLVGYDSDSD